MPSEKDKKICLIGAGLVGALLAILLAEEGFSVDVYEKRKDPRTDTTVRGRSISLSLSDRGWSALRQVGLEDMIRKTTYPAHGRIVHQKEAATYSQNYGDGSQAIWTVNRNYLNSVLIEKAAATGRATFFFEHSFEDLNEKTSEIIFPGPSPKEKIKKSYDHIIGVDGVFSAVRKDLSEKKLWNFESSLLDFGYKELSIPRDAQGKHILTANHLHVWPRKNSTLVAFPTIEGDFVTNLFLPLAGEDSLASINAPELLMEFFKREYADVIPLMPDLEKEFFSNPNSTITQVKGGPWHYGDKVLLMGDSAHAVTPFYGMGMNVGFEDCIVFMELLKENDHDFGKTFASLGKVRKPNTDALFELSYKNFQSLSESPDPSYQEKWLLERRIWKLFPEQWTPTYVLIAFSETPLKEVPAIKEKQDHLLQELMVADPNVLDLTDEELKALFETTYSKSAFITS